MPIETTPDSRLTPQQLRLWTLQQAGAPGRSRCALRITGELDGARLWRALRAVVDRHELLRTTFVPGDDGGAEPVARAVPAGAPGAPAAGNAGDLELPSFELAAADQAALGLGAGDLAALGLGLGRRDRGAAGVDRAAAGAVAAALLRCGAGEHLLLLELPAMCADPATFRNLSREIAAACAAAGGGSNGSLAYAGVAAWQEQWLASPEGSEGVEFWRHYWAEREIGGQLAARLPLAEEPPAAAQCAPAALPLTLPPGLQGALDGALREYQVEAPVLLLTAWLLLLWRGTGRADALSGVLHDGRSLEELAPVLGPLAGYVPVHLRIDGRRSAHEVVAAVRRELSASLTWRDYFFWHRLDLPAAVEPAGEAPFFPACFASGEAWQEEAGGLRFAAAGCDHRVDRFTLELAHQAGRDPGRERHALALRYDRRCFRRDAVERLGARLLAVLAGLVAGPRMAVEELPCMGESERLQVLSWAVAGSAPMAGNLVDRLAAQAARTPQHPALVWRGETLSYAELAARVHRLAHHLRAAGVGGEARVGLLLERSADMVVAILAVLAAGGAWVPLSPDHPAERLALLLADVGAEVVVTLARWRDAMPPPAGARRVICLDEEAPQIAALPAARPEVEIRDGALAYVIYTSGSTGVPKGVQVEHRSMLHLLVSLQAMAPRLCAAPLRATLNAPLLFDASIQQLTLLLAGHTLCIVPEEVRTDPDAMLQFLRRERVDLLDCTPSMLRTLVDAGLLSAPGPAMVWVGGEAVDADLWQALRAAPEREVYNVYGPTECTVDATSHRVGSAAGGPLLGRALVNCEAWLLGTDLRPVPVGAAGEIYLGGSGVSRGYLGRPDLTAERFLPHPFSPAPGARLYRSGDLGRHRPDGELEFLGRADRQLKIRGYRIEPEEVEAVLRRHPAVREAAVAVRNRQVASEDVAALVAWVQPAAGAPVDLAAVLLRHLRAHLPPYMVPATVVPLAVLPLTAGGKLDRRALPDAEPGRRAQPYVAPRHAVEELLAGIWEEVLGVEPVGVEDDFFTLGGHSLLAMQVMSRARGVVHPRLSIRHLFKRPTVAGLAALVGEELGGTRRVPLAVIPRVPRGAGLPLSFSQERLWLLHQLDPWSPAYNIPFAVRLLGRLGVPELAASLGEIVRRHEVLRTRIAMADDLPVQVASPAAAVPLPVIDLTGLPPAGREREALRLAGEEARRPFDLARGPLLRQGLVRLGVEEHVALFTLHHIVSDAWSMGILVRELGPLYDAALRGGRSPLPELAIQYADFAVWQRQRLTGETLSELVAYWRQVFAELPPPLALPTDRPRPALPAFRGSVRSFAVPAIVPRLAACSRRHGATPFMTLLAVFAALLQRYSGQQDLAVGTPIAGRDHPQAEDLIGFFINTLALRADLAGDPGFDALLARVREAALGAFTHQELPFEKLVEELQPARDAGRAPLFQAMFVYQNAPEAALRFPGLRLEPLPADGGAAKLDLTLSLAAVGDALRGAVEHDSDLWDAATIIRLQEHFRILLAGALERPEARLSELPLLTPAERAQLVDAGGVDLAAAPAELVTDRFAAWVQRAPLGDALVYEGRVVTYGELARAASALAARLAALGIGPESRVGICVEPSPEMIVALLAVLVAGGAYVPLDPSLPAERAAALLADSGAKLLLTQQRLAPAFAAHPLPLLLLDGEPSALEPAPRGSLPPHQAADVAYRGPVSPHQAAYVVYTSGSTGAPKGVVASHGGLANFAAAMADLLEIRPGDRMLQFASLSFDASVVQIFPPLVSGAAVVLHPAPRRLAPHELLQLCVATGTTLFDIPAALWRQLASDAGHGAGRGAAPIRVYLTGGESVPVAALRAWAAQVPPGTGFLSSYGPTETTVTATTFRSRSDRVAGLGPADVPLGEPLAGVRVLLLDSWLGPVPIGVAGEVCIGGAGVTRGYLGDPARSAERFVPDALSPQPGARLYRTGDQARRLADGSLQFLGRRDQQLKLRGYRVEPGEVEAVLAGAPGVGACAVVTRESAGGQRRLVAFAVPRPGVELAAAELRRHLAERLPEYMIPAAIACLDALPLTVGGKVDRRALAQLRGVAFEDAPPTPAAPARPSTPLEESVAAIWADLLEVAAPGLDDNFFELGGHSLLATRVVSRLRQAFGIELPLRRLFEHPTVAGLALVVEEAQGAARPLPAPPMIADVAGVAGLPAPLSFAQQRLWFLDRLQPGGAHYNIPLALGVSGPMGLDRRLLAACLDEVARRHAVLRTTFAMDETGEAWQVVAPPGPVPLPVVDLGALPEAARRGESRRLIHHEAARPFDLARGPLLRAALLAAAGEQVLLLTLHHIVSDGWSMGILLNELGELYAAAAAGRPSALPALPLQYVDFARWQRQWLQGDALLAQLGFWRQQLAGVAASLELPVDRRRPPLQSFRGASRTVVLGAELTSGLGRLCRQLDATPFMALLAAFQVLLHRTSVQDRFNVGSPIAGRNRAELEPLVGLFVNTLVFPADLAGDPLFAAVLARLRGRTLAAFDHQELPFEKLVDELKVERDLARPPLFQVLFALQNAPLPLPPLDARGLVLRSLDEHPGVVKFELSLSLVAAAGGGMLGGLEYNSDLFDAATVERLVRQFQRLVAAIVAEPATRVWDLALLGDGERHQIALEWNDTAPPERGELSLHGLVEAQARRTPDAAAVICAASGLTYGELNSRANRLARALRRHGAGLGTPVAICMERSLDLVVGLLAILKAGAAYVPFDPTHPQERLDLMLEELAASVSRPLVLTDEAHAGRFAGAAAAAAVRVLAVDAAGGAIAAERDADLDLAVPAASLAYVIYTSGSTGRPKGAMNVHGAICNRLLWMQGAYRLAPADRVLQKTPFTFDVSVWELFWPLATGACMVVARPEGHKDSAYLIDLMARHRVTTVHFVPSMLQAMLDAPGWERCTSLARVIASGEALSGELRQRLFARLRPACPAVELHNLYGPTEAAVDVTAHACTADEAERPVPIGRPIAAIDIQLLGTAGRAVAVGVAGELHIGGAGLARGYFGRPDLTAERFVPDAGGRRPGARLYRTGDLARWLPDGAIDYLGRIDHQVKVRGFRIEPGEIEAVLLRHAAVAEAVVLARRPELGAGELRLVAYLVAAAARTIAVQELRDHLAMSLPDAMIPAFFVTLPALPRTSSGKLDRRALPEPAAGRAALDGDYVAPRTPAEEILCGVWAQVLGVEPVGIHDNFFALGGDSILSLRVVALAGGRGLAIPLQELFRHQTVAALAAAVAPSLGGAREAAASAPFSLLDPAVRERLPAAVEDAYPVATLQAGMLYHMALTERDPLYHNVESWLIRCPFAAEPFRAAVQAVVARHPVLRTGFDLTGFGEPLQLVYRAAHLPVGVDDIRHLSWAEQERVVDERVVRDKRELFDLLRPPQLRIHLHRRSDSTFQLTVTENHAIFDGWSLHSTLAEIFELYFAQLDGEPLTPLPPLRSTYRDFIAEERRALASPDAQAFWSRLVGDSSLLQLAGWETPPRDGGPRMRGIQVAVPAPVADGVGNLARRALVPLRSVLLAAYMKLLGVLSGQADVLAGQVTNGRLEVPDGDQVRGLFLNTLPFRLALAPGSWTELVQGSFAAELEMIPHRRFPFAVLQRQWGDRPLFDVAFNYIHFHVVRDLMQSGRLEVLGFRQAEGTSFRLLAHFSRSLAGARLEMYLEYDSFVLPRAQVQAIGERFVRLLGAMGGEPLARHDEAALLSAAERHQLLAEHNDTAAVYPAAAEPCLHRLIEAQAAHTPEAVAVVFADELLSFGELNARANQLARCLRRQGVGPDVPVGLCAERSLELMVGLLAILKAGGAYVPLDPSYPRERLAFMLGDALAGGARAPLLAQRRWAEALLDDLAAGIAAAAAGPPPPAVVRLDAPAAGLDAEPRGDLPGGAGPDHLAYVIYTSGSTGRPKGAMNSHRAVCNRLLWMQAAFRLAPADVVLQKTPLSFDVSVWELFWPLIAGARLVLARPEGHRDSLYLVELIERQQVTTLHFVPSMLQAFLDEPELERCGASLRRTIASGEALSAELQRQFFARLGSAGAELHNLYGPTEAAVDVSWWPCRAGDPAAAVPIGRPIGNLRLHLLDRDLGVVPIGAPGELFIGGAGVGRGYLGRPALTAERFVPDPTAGEPGSRLYRTGDLARRRPGGEIDYLGRLDHQVKVRGFRIELGEIDAVLAALPEVREAVTLARPDAAGRLQLVACVVARGELTAQALREQLRRRLPEPMVPSRFLLLDSLPLLPNGKLDRRALAALHVQEPPRSVPYAPPATAMEVCIAAVWKEVLHLEQVGVDDAFFDLGGHSLALLQVQRLLRDRLGRQISMLDLFRAPTIAALARQLSGEEATGAAAAADGDQRAGLRLKARRREPRPAPQEEAEDLAMELEHAR
jgi:amino acid adenylation domain-containing protein